MKNFILIVLSLFSIGLFGQKGLPFDRSDKFKLSTLWTKFEENGRTMSPTVPPVVIYESITHDNLVTLQSNNALVEGRKYLINDFKTRFLLNISNTPYTDATLEPLVVTATSNNTLDPIAFSPAYPKDIIYYSLSNNGYMAGSDKGCIYRRIDTEKNISVPFDFREFKVEVAEFMLTPYSSGTYTKGQIFDSDGGAYASRRNDNSESTSNATWWLNLGSVSKFRAAKPVDFFFGGTLGLNSGAIAYTERCFNIGFSYNFVITAQPTNISECLFMTFGYIQDCEFERLDNCFFNTEDELRNNKCGILKDVVFGGSFFRGNNIGDLRGLFLGGNFQDNVIENGFEENVIFSANSNRFGKDAKYNILGSEFNNNTIEKGFELNSLGDNCGDEDGDNKGNHFGPRFRNNALGDNCVGNRIGGFFANNIAGNRLRYNNLTYGFRGNILGDDFELNNINGLFANNTISLPFQKNSSTADFTGCTVAFVANNFRIDADCVNKLFAEDSPLDDIFNDVTKYIIQDGTDGLKCLYYLSTIATFVTVPSI